MPPPFVPRCRLFNIGPKIGPPSGPPFFACRPNLDLPLWKILDPPLSSVFQWRMLSSPLPPKNKIIYVFIITSIYFHRNVGQNGLSISEVPSLLVSAYICLWRFVHPRRSKLNVLVLESGFVLNIPIYILTRYIYYSSLTFSFVNTATDPPRKWPRWPVIGQ